MCIVCESDVCTCVQAQVDKIRLDNHEGMYEDGGGPLQPRD
jgi:hypothetical protein